jgi:hypothetical protein
VRGLYYTHFIGREVPFEWGHFNMVIKGPAIIDTPFQNNTGATELVMETMLGCRLPGENDDDDEKPGHPPHSATNA